MISRFQRAQLIPYYYKCVNCDYKKPPKRFEFFGFYHCPKLYFKLFPPNAYCKKCGGPMTIRHGYAKTARL